MSTNSNPTVAPIDPASITDPALRAIAAGLGAGQQPNAGSTQVSAQPTPPEEVEVDVEPGLKKRVPMKELRDAYVARTQVERDREAVKAGLAKIAHMPGVQRLYDQLQSLSPAQTAQVLAIVEGKPPSSTNGHARPARTADDEIEAALDDTQPPAAAGVHDDRLNRMERALEILASRESQRINGEREQSTGSRVDKLMGDYPVFRQTPEAAAFAKDFIMTQVLHADGEPDLDGIVRQAASKLLGLQQKKQQAETVSSRTTHLAPEVTSRLNAKGLKAGHVREIARRMAGPSQ